MEAKPMKHRPHSAQYENYIRFSPVWQEKRKQRLEIDGYKCVMCGKTAAEAEAEGKPLQIHHVSYDRLFDEDVIHDLCVLCPRCHELIGNYYSRIKY